MRVKSNLDQIIYDHIVDSLILGEYSMGQTVLLDEFAKKYEVSRTPVVQAVKLLSNDGLLETMTNGRVRVPQFNEEQMMKICEVRLLLENYALEKIYNSKQTNDIFYDELEHIAKQGLSALNNGDSLEFNKIDLEFHRTLISGSNNEYLVAEYNRIQGKFVVANYLMKPLEERDFSCAAESHIEIVELLRSNEFDQCRKLLNKHIFSFSTPF